MVKEGLLNFVKKMEKVLKEKEPKYENNWENIPIGELRTKMNEQIKNISTILMSGVTWDKKKVKRSLVHIANYCYFMHNKI
ncbi:hypothetical protein LCGC14_0900500 [marine sediment metagenome]|uniref:Uncharacterized protein n=1 Tax=marine sediment metagenome TaxID=412755 RepID=A0A0F9S3H3_9ZZZZ